MRARFDGTRFSLLVVIGYTAVEKIEVIGLESD